MIKNRYLRYNIKLALLNSDLIILGGKYNKKIFATDIILEIIKYTSFSREEDIIIETVKRNKQISTEKVLIILNILVEKGFLLKNNVAIKFDVNNTIVNQEDNIRNFAIITCERPKRLFNSANTYIKNFKKNSHNISSIIFDDSLKYQYDNQNIIKKIATFNKEEIGYVDITNRHQLIDLINTRTGISRELISFAILPCFDKCNKKIFSAGASRNVAMLYFSDTKFLIADDDSTPVGNNFSVSNRNLSLSRGRGIFIPEYLEEQPHKNQNIDIITLNERYLGYSLPDIMKDTTEFSIDNYFYDNHLLLSRKKDYESSHIAYTMNSIQGAQDISIDTMLTEEKELYHGWYNEKSDTDFICMDPFLLTTMLTGFDTRYFNVPFFPMYRNEDTITGMINNYFNRSTLSVCINSNLLHREACETQQLLYSKTDFYEEILFPLIIESILKKIKFQTTGQFISYENKAYIFKSYVDRLCGNNVNEFFTNMEKENLRIAEICIKKISDNMMKFNDNYIPYINKHPRSLDEIIKSNKMNNFCIYLKKYAELIIVWPTIMDCCSDLRIQNKLPKHTIK